MWQYFAPDVPIATNIFIVGNFADEITYTTFEDVIFIGYDFTGGSNFPFSYLFLHGPYNSAARLRCLRSSKAERCGN